MLESSNILLLLAKSSKNLRMCRFMDQQIKSRQRVTDHGEVFTAEREVNAMLDLVKQETERIDSTFLDIKTPRLIQFNYSSADFAA